MSWSVSPATATAVNASISTPVCPEVATVAVTSMVSAPIAKSTSTDDNAS